MFYWGGLQKNVLRYVKGCEACQFRKGPSNVKLVELLQAMPIGKLFDRIGIDLLGPFKKNRKGNKMIICVIDYCTKWLEIRALPDGATKGITKFILEDIICRHGVSRHILTNRGKVFQSGIPMGSQKQFTTSFHPQCNSFIEKINLVLANMLSMYTNSVQTNWYGHLRIVTFAYNSSQQDTLGMSSFNVVHGVEALLPAEGQIVPASGEDERLLTLTEFEEPWKMAKKRTENIQKKGQKQVWWKAQRGEL